MQDRYAGDVGDFGKFALLEALHRANRGTLGVIWYRVKDEVHNNDGRHTGYRNNERFKGLNPKLLKSMEVVLDGTRSIAALEASIELLKSARCWSSPVPTADRMG